MAATLEPRERGGPIQKYWEETSTISQLGKFNIPNLFDLSNIKYYEYYPIVNLFKIKLMNIKMLESVKAWLLKNAKKVIINILIFLVYYQYPTGGSVLENEVWSPRAPPRLLSICTCLVIFHFSAKILFVLLLV